MVKGGYMKVSRRGFIKMTGAGAACLTLSRLGFDLGPTQAYAAGLKTAGCKEVVSICPFCSCGCNIIMSVKDGVFVSSEGDPDYPVSEGSLCAKGAAFHSMHVSEHRVLKPLYRAPGSDKWEEKDWNFVLDRIAKRVKETRDRDFILKNEKGQTANRVESIFQLGTSQMDNEECAVSHQMLRGLGVVHFDHQARV
jgi:formate dehydrogenase major subunit